MDNKKPTVNLSLTKYKKPNTSKQKYINEFDKNENRQPSNTIFLYNGAANSRTKPEIAYIYTTSTLQ